MQEEPKELFLWIIWETVTAMCPIAYNALLCVLCKQGESPTWPQHNDWSKEIKVPVVLLSDSQTPFTGCSNNVLWSQKFNPHHVVPLVTLMLSKFFILEQFINLSLTFMILMLLKIPSSLAQDTPQFGFIWCFFTMVFRSNIHICQENHRHNVVLFSLHPGRWQMILLNPVSGDTDIDHWLRWYFYCRDSLLSGFFLHLCSE